MITVKPINIPTAKRLLADHGDLLPKFRAELPHARGADLSDAELAEIAVKALNTAINDIRDMAPWKIDRGDKRDFDWLDQPSTQRSLLLLAFIHGDKVRKHGGASSMTHPLDVAHLAYNFPQRQCPELSTFCAIHHDSLEDDVDHLIQHNKLSIDDTDAIQRRHDALLDMVLLCWGAGTGLSAGDRIMIKRNIRDLTDPAELVGPNANEIRHWHQIVQSLKPNKAFSLYGNSKYNPVVSIVRYCDKLSNASLDLLGVHRRVITHPHEISKRAKLARQKNMVIDVLGWPVLYAHKIIYTRVIEALEKAAGLESLPLNDWRRVSRLLTDRISPLCPELHAMGTKLWLLGNNPALKPLEAVPKPHELTIASIFGLPPSPNRLKLMTNRRDAPKKRVASIS